LLFGDVLLYLANRKQTEMSYDLMVFKKLAAPKSRVDFMKWYYIQTQFTENHSYNDPANTAVGLNNWFLDMIKIFPAMNGPYSNHDDDNDNEFITGYSIGSDVIYIDFRWSVAEKAYNTTLELAEKHRVGFFDVSSDNGDILFPENGKLVSIDELDENHKEANVKSSLRKRWWRFW
jgi:hypothetical protein